MDRFSIVQTVEYSASGYHVEYSPGDLPGPVQAWGPTPVTDLGYRGRQASTRPHGGDLVFIDKPRSSLTYVRAYAMHRCIF